MSPEKFKLTVLFRRPVYPVIVISADRLRVADSQAELAVACQRSTPAGPGPYLILVDSALEEFWFDPQHQTVMPGFMNIHWPKKRLIEVYNASANARETGMPYPLRSINNKSIVRVATDIAALVRASEALTT